MKQGKFLIIVPNFVLGVKAVIGYHIPRMKRFHRIKDTDEYYIFTIKDGKIVRYVEKFDEYSSIWSKIRSMFRM